MLPPLLYIAAYFTPIQSLRANLVTISSLADFERELDLEERRMDA